MTLWIILTINSIALAGLLFLLSAGFSLIFGLMRIPNLTHGALFMLGAYFGVTFLRLGFSFWIAAILSAIVLGIIGALIERLLLRRLAGQELAQVLVTLGLAFIIADVCLLVWTGDPIPLTTPESLRGVFRAGTVVRSYFRSTALPSSSWLSSWPPSCGICSNARDSVQRSAPVSTIPRSPASSESVCRGCSRRYSALARRWPDSAAF
jgi:branched-chain amino acid transport system permease protein